MRKYVRKNLKKSIFWANIFSNRLDILYSALTQIPTFTLLLIVFAEHPENTHKTKTLTINEDNERLQWCTLILRDSVIDPSIEELLLSWIAFADLDIALPLHDIKHSD